MKRFYKIINYRSTIYGGHPVYRNNNVSKENFYKKFGRDCRKWDEKAVSGLIWEYVGETKHIFLNLCIVYNRIIDAYIITHKSNLESCNAYALKYHYETY